MDNLMKTVKKDWKLYCTALWMFLSIAFFTWISIELMNINKRLDHVDSNTGAIEGIVTATDFNVDNINKNMAHVKSVVNKIAVRVKRR
ncbi:MAG: hypothetical protein DRH32_04990 [Deltaproteobacteria bacterium]|nr:MAG: hypothetical protein DRH32_04990 [Deltaproteobacteria bacterium]